MTRLVSQFLKVAAVACNGLFALWSLFRGLISMAADIGIHEAYSMFAWAASWAVASIVVIVALLVPKYAHPLIWSGYGAIAFHLLAFLREWEQHFNLSSDLLPPQHLLPLLGLALLSTLALTVNRPPRQDPIWKSRWSRNLLIVGILTVTLVGGLRFAMIARRVQSQYASAQHILKLGGGVHWESGWVGGVYLKGTETKDEDLRVLRQFPRLESVYLARTPITDAGLTQLSHIDSIDSLYLYETAITDRGLQAIAGLTRMRNLWLGETQITDEGLTSLRRMTQVEYLDLAHTQVTDAGLPQLYHMQKMYYLHLTGTTVSEAALQRIATKLPNLSACNGETCFPRKSAN